MGKARIVSSDGEGLYSIEVLIDRQRIDAEIAWIDGRMDDAFAERDEARAQLTLRQMEVSEMSMWINVLIERLHAFA